MLIRCQQTKNDKESLHDSISCPKKITTEAAKDNADILNKQQNYKSMQREQTDMKNTNETIRQDRVQRNTIEL